MASIKFSVSTSNLVQCLNATHAALPNRQPFCTHVLNQGLVSSHFVPSPVIAGMFGDYQPQAWNFQWPDRLSQSVEDKNVWVVEFDGPFEAGTQLQWKFFLGPMVDGSVPDPLSMDEEFHWDVEGNRRCTWWSEDTNSAGIHYQNRVVRSCEKKYEGRERVSVKRSDVALRIIFRDVDQHNVQPTSPL